MIIKDLDGVEPVFEKVESVAQDLSNVKNVGPQYIPVYISSAPLFGVPKVVYIRMFSVEDMMLLSMVMDNEIIFTRYLIQILNNNLFQDEKKSIDVSTWHEKQVQELLLHVLINFSNPLHEGTPYILDEEDEAFLKETDEATYKAYKNGEKEFTTTVDFRQAKTFSRSEIQATLTYKHKDMEVVFYIPVIRDTVLLNTFIQEYLYKINQRYNVLVSKSEHGDEITFEESEFMKEAVLEKAFITTKMTKTFFVKKVIQNNIVLYEEETMPLTAQEFKKKYDLMEHISIPLEVFNSYSDTIEGLEIGINPLMKVISPITGKTVERRYSFRVKDFFILLFVS